MSSCGGSNEEYSNRGNDSIVEEAESNTVTSNSILIGVSLGVSDPDAVAEDFAEKHDGYITGKIREVREYQLYFPGVTDERMGFILESLEADPDVIVIAE
jgi:hypothetical protein